MSSNCKHDYQQSVDNYNGVVIFSLLVTAFMMVARSSCQNPSFYFGMATLKIFLGTLLFTALYPTCPPQCLCGKSDFSFYPMVVIIIGCIWLMRGIRLLGSEQTRGGTSGNTEGYAGVASHDIEAVPTVHAELVSTSK